MTQLSSSSSNTTESTAAESTVAESTVAESTAAESSEFEPLTMVKLRMQAARALGCRVTELDPETGYLNEIAKDDVRRVLVGGLSPLNDAVAARIVGDKFHTLNVLGKRGFRVPQTVRCLKPGHFRNDDYAAMTGLDPALSFADQHPWPLIVKPNFGSRGLDIACVHSRQELVEAIEQVWRRDYLALVQVAASGFDLRIDFLDDQYLFGYTRNPVRLEGDGQSSVRQLMKATDSRFRGEGFEQRLQDDDIWRRETESTNLDLDSIPPAGQVVDFATPILNLNRLCVGRRQETLSEPWQKLGVRIGRVFSLRHFGIDLKIESMDQDPTEATVIEVNSSPSLAHMSRMGHFEAALAAEKQIVGAILDATPPSLDF